MSLTRTIIIEAMHHYFSRNNFVRYGDPQILLLFVNYQLQLKIINVQQLPKNPGSCCLANCNLASTLVDLLAYAGLIIIHFVQRKVLVFVSFSWQFY